MRLAPPAAATTEGDDCAGLSVGVADVEDVDVTVVGEREVCNEVRGGDGGVEISVGDDGGSGDVGGEGGMELSGGGGEGCGGDREGCDDGSGDGDGAGGG